MQYELMSKEPTEVGSERKNKGLTLLLIILALAELGVGISGIFFLKKTDHAYSELVDTTTGLLAHFRTLGVNGSNIQRHCLNLLLSENPSETQTFKEKLVNEWKMDDDALGAITQIGTNKLSVGGLAKLLSSRDTYRRNYESFLALALPAGKREAMDYLAKSLRPAFQTYQTAQTDLVRQLVNSAGANNVELSHASKFRQRILMTFVAWPVVLAVVFLLVVAYVVWIFRGYAGDDV